MARELLRLTKEAVYGVPKTSPVTGDQILLDIQTDNGYTVRPALDFWVMRSAAASNMVVRRGSNKVNLRGRLGTYILPGQFAWLMGMLTNLGDPVNHCRELGSFTAEYGRFGEDGTCEALLERHTGCKFARATIVTDDSTQGALMMGTFDIVASKKDKITTTTFPIPAMTDYLHEDPFMHQQTENLVLVDGEERDPSSISIEIENDLKPYFGNAKFLRQLGWKGRTTTATLRSLLMSIADWDRYEAIEKIAVSIEYMDPVKTAKFDFGDQNVITGLAEDLKMDDFAYQTLTIENQISVSTGEDFTITIADTEDEEEEDPTP